MQFNFYDFRFLSYFFFYFQGTISYRYLLSKQRHICIHKVFFFSRISIRKPVQDSIINNQHSEKS